MCSGNDKIYFSVVKHMKTNHEILHWMSLKNILQRMVDVYGFESLDKKLKMNCFSHNPSIKSSLIFLRKTPWAREKVEELYVEFMRGESF